MSIDAKRSAWKGLGVWNIYFLAKFSLALAGYLNLEMLANAVLAAFVMIPLPGRVLGWVRGTVATIAGIGLAWHESWLPGYESVRDNFSQITGFSVEYLCDLAVSFINPEMLGGLFVLTVGYFALRNIVRFSTITLGLMGCLFAQPHIEALLAPVLSPEQPAQQTVAAGNAEKSPATAPALLLPAQTAAPDNAGLSAWVEQFLAHEKTRKVDFPTSLAASDTPFHIAIVNLCSMATDDIEAAGLSEHPLLKHFDIYFDRFNSATAYSGPATLRLLRAAGGQPSHVDLYNSPNSDSEIMNRLEKLGFEQRAYFDHPGEYGNYLSGLRELAGFKPQLTRNPQWPARFTAFDGTRISDDEAVLRTWLKDLDSAPSRTVTLFNFITMHDGNRGVADSREVPFAPRAKATMDALETILNEAEKSGKKILFCIVPEHGAAVRGDKVQTARLRDIPSHTITRVPVMIRFIGNPKADTPVRIAQPSSYQAFAQLVVNAIDTNCFGTSVRLEDLAKDLPATHWVSENGSAQVIDYRGNIFVRLQKGRWLPYAK